MNWDHDQNPSTPPWVVVAGRFLTAGSVRSDNVAAYDPATGQWFSFVPVQANAGAATSLAVLPNGDLVVGGEFTFLGGNPVPCIARWDGDTWMPLGGGIDIPVAGFVAVRALAVLPNGDLVIGGIFASVGGVPAASIARWNGSTWSPLGGGLNGIVDALAVLPNGDVIAGGQFTSYGAAAAQNIARWDGTSWLSLGAGTNGRVRAIAISASGHVFAGGEFTAVGSLAVGHVARWDGQAWSAVGGGLGPNADVRSLSVLPNGDVVACGMLVVGGSPVTNNVARWNGTSWVGLGSGVPVARTLVSLPNGELIVGCVLDSRPNMMRWNGSGWSPLVDGPHAVTTALHALPAGGFVATGVVYTPFNPPFWVNSVGSSVMRWDGAGWSTLLVAGPPAELRAFAVRPNGDIVVGGLLPPGNLARWNGTSWSSFGTGTNGIVHALTTLPNGDVVVGGAFTLAGGANASNVARWNGATWAPLGTGLNGTVLALATLANGDLIAGGSFSGAGTLLASNVALWNGSIWQPLGAGITGAGPVRVNSLLVMPDGDVVAGGWFSTAGGVAANNVARWDGIAWAALGAGTNADVEALAALPGGDVVAGGWFSSAGGVPANRIARWNGAAWSPFGAGMDGNVFALAGLSNGELVAGGEFAVAGGVVSARVARLTTTCPATVSAVGAGCTGSGGPNALAAQSLPWLGTTFRSVASGMPAIGVVVSVRGLSLVTIPLVSLLPLGGPGCSLLVAPDLLELQLPTAGSVTTAIDIPPAAALVGRVLHQQVVALELGPGAGIIAVTSTNGLSLTIGAF